MINLDNLFSNMIASSIICSHKYTGKPVMEILDFYTLTWDNVKDFINELKEFEKTPFDKDISHRIIPYYMALPCSIEIEESKIPSDVIRRYSKMHFDAASEDVSYIVQMKNLGQHSDTITKDTNLSPEEQFIHFIKNVRAIHTIYLNRNFEIDHIETEYDFVGSGIGHTTIEWHPAIFDEANKYQNTIKANYNGRFGILDNITIYPPNIGEFTSSPYYTLFDEFPWNFYYKASADDYNIDIDDRVTLKDFTVIS